MVLNPDNLQSSYRKNNYGEVFEAIAFLSRPKITVEVGVLEGYSASHLAKYSEQLVLVDIFDEFAFHHADRSDIEKKFPQSNIIHMNYYDFRADNAGPFESGIDLLHVDIANTGDTYRHFLSEWYPCLSEGGIAILEGGSEERDGYWWMKAFKKPPIRAALDEFREAGIQFHVIEAFPSLTIVRK